ncbi:MAG: NAD(+) diphosphatase [Pseudomonadota bacterium]
MFAASTLDRCGEYRGDPEWVAARRREPGARVALFAAGRPLAAESDDAGRALAVVWATFAELDALSPEPMAVFLGRTPGGTALFAADVTEAERAAGQAEDERESRLFKGPGPAFYCGLRDGAHRIDPADAAHLAQARSMLDWHRRHRFCANCGAPSVPDASGYKRNCPSCGAEHFPRTDPVVIVLPVRAGRILLGRGPHFPPNMYSALAGFVEPGETFEQAAKREVYEEARVRIEAVRYCFSQPWPFPSSLMVGCLADAITDDVELADKELEDAIWVTADEARAALSRRWDQDGLLVPPPSAIANQLIQLWVRGVGV